MKKAKSRFRGHRKAKPTHTATITTPSFPLPPTPPKTHRAMPRPTPTRQEAEDALWASMMKHMGDKGPREGFGRFAAQDALREDPSRVVVEMEQARDGSICGVCIHHTQDGVIMRRRLPVLDGEDPQRVAATLLGEVVKQAAASPSIAPNDDNDPDDDGYDDFDNLPDDPHEPPLSPRVAPLPNNHPLHRPWLPAGEPEGHTEASRFIEAHPWKIPFYGRFDLATEDAQLVWFLTHNADAIREADGMCRFVWEATVRSAQRDAGPWTITQTLAQIQARVWLPVPLAWSLAPHLLAVVAPYLADSHNASLDALRRPIEIKGDYVRGSRLELESLRRAFSDAAKQGVGWPIRVLASEPVEVCSMRLD